MEWPDYEFQEYPKMVYPGAKDQNKPYVTKPGRAFGKPLGGILVNNEEEERQALSLPDEDDDSLIETGAPGTRRLVTEDDERTALIERADVLGVQVDKRWSTARLTAAIEAAQGEVV